MSRAGAASHQSPPYPARALGDLSVVTVTIKAPVVTIAGAGSEWLWRALDKAERDHSWPSGKGPLCHRRA